MTIACSNQSRIAPDSARIFLRDQYDQSSSGIGRLVMVSGGIASGKTALQNELLDYAVSSGALTLSATGAPDEQEIGAAVIDQLLANSSCPIEVPSRQNAIPGTASGKKDDRSTRLSDDQAEARYVRNVCDTILDLARSQPIVIGVDDLHFADETSLKLLLQLQRRIRSAKLLILLNQSDWQQSPFTRLSTYFARQPRYFSVQLTPMSEQAIRVLLEGSLDGGFDDELPLQIHTLSAGNPMLANALVDDYREGGRGGHAVVGSAYARAVHAFLDRPDTKLLEVTAALAVLGGRSGSEQIAKLTDVHPQAVTTLLDALAHAGLLVDGGFRHPRARAAVLESLSPASRTCLHASAAQLKHLHASSATDVAKHLVAAGETPSGWSVPVLRKAADHAVGANDVEFAAQALDLALSASDDVREQLSIQQSIIGSTWRVNPSAAASYVPSLREAAEAGTLDQDGCFALMRHALWQGDKETFVRAHKVLTSSPEPVDPQTEAELNLAYEWHFGPITNRPDLDEPAIQPRSAPWNQTAGTLKQAWRRGGNDATNASAERILQNCRLGDTSLEALATAITALTLGGKSDSAERWCARFGLEARQRSAVTWQAVFEALRAGILLQRGEVTASAERARSSLALLGEHNWGVSVTHPLATMLYADVAAGAFDDAARTLRIPVPDAAFETIGGLRYLRARGHFHLATNRPLAAVSDFQRCQQMMRRWDSVATTPVPWRSDLAEANLQLGNIEVARDLAKQQIKLSMDSDPHACGLALRVLAFASGPTEDSRLLGRAAKAFQDSGNQLELNRTLKAIARFQALGQDKRPTVVRPAHIPEQKSLPARQSPASTKALDHTRTADTVVPAGNSVARRDQPDSGDASVLSEAELRVAQLAVRGFTNREISSRLFVTVSTVEQHLTRAYRKLGIRGRRALADELRQRHPAVHGEEQEFRLGLKVQAS
ncbi:AAA family ATPase [Streptomyces sp. NPDC050433]|uniref:AAA family ATPase n=1 Tax=unclassified Streptomyces TaxID=2593676 RepID=UPI0034481BB3